MLVLFVSGTIGPRGCQHHDSYFHHMAENTELRKLELKKGSFLLLVLFDVESSEHAIKLRVPNSMGSILTSLKTISF